MTGEIAKTARKRIERPVGADRALNAANR